MEKHKTTKDIKVKKKNRNYKGCEHHIENADPFCNFVFNSLSQKLYNQNISLLYCVQE